MKNKDCFLFHLAYAEIFNLKLEIYLRQTGAKGKNLNPGCVYFLWNPFKEDWSIHTKASKSLQNLCNQSTFSTYVRKTQRVPIDTMNKRKRRFVREVKQYRSENARKCGAPDSVEF